MTSRDPLERLQQSWQSDPGDGTLASLNPDALERRAHKLAKQVKLRNVMEWSAAVMVVVIFSAWGWSADRWLTQLGCTWTVGTALWISWVLIRRGGNLPRPALDAPMNTFLRYQHAQLERQADLLERVPTWYVLPLAIGSVIILADRLWAAIERGAQPIAITAMAVSILVVCLVYIGVMVVNRRAATQMRQQLDGVGGDGDPCSDG